MNIARKVWDSLMSVCFVSVGHEKREREREKEREKLILFVS